jgi:hypothetical protein
MYAAVLMDRQDGIAGLPFFVKSSDIFCRISLRFAPGTTGCLMDAAGAKEGVGDREGRGTDSQRRQEAFLWGMLGNGDRADHSAFRHFQ